MKSKLNQPKAEPEQATDPQNGRETVESIVIAFILAFLFRAFVAEAFVIPTGSMAPTLMGAHKDIQCEYCGAQFQNTASFEFHQDLGGFTDRAAIGGLCSVCRAKNAYDLAGNANHATFSGDRILVSKFDYIFRDPERWDVLVFKFPLDARMNYIKRLVGLPGEQLRIEEGDVYTRKSADQAWQIARKPPHKIVAMSQVVSDTQHLSSKMIEAGWPSLWQPWPRPESATSSDWQVDQVNPNWRATLKATANETKWLRYFHQYLDAQSWHDLAHGRQPPPAAAYNVNLITDHLAYNTTIHSSRRNLYDGARLRSDVTSSNRALEILDGTHETDSAGQPFNDGLHWVGDLAVEFDVEIKSDSGKVSLDLVEFGIHYRCEIDVASGKATLLAIDKDQPAQVFAEGSPNPTAATRVNGKGRYRIRLANFDDRIVMWVNNWLVNFDGSTDFDSHRLRQGSQRRPHWSVSDPMDAAPIGIGGQGIELEVHRAQVWRDIYYIAISRQRINSRYYSDYDLFDSSIVDSLPDLELRNQINNWGMSMDARSWLAISAIYSQPEWWEKSSLFASRNSNLEFQLDQEQFFPMGDNSAASSDARAWDGHHFVERKYLVGKALLVFFPHYWRAPVPFLPNFGRMRLIR